MKSLRPIPEDRQIRIEDSTTKIFDKLEIDSYQRRKLQGDAPYKEVCKEDEFKKVDAILADVAKAKEEVEAEAFCCSIQ